MLIGVADHFIAGVAGAAAADSTSASAAADSTGGTGTGLLFTVDLGICC